MNDDILLIKNLVIEYELKRYSIRAIDDVTMAFKRGSITAIVGESGSGKTTLASAILEVISSPGRIISGDVLYFQNAQGFETKINNLKPKQLNHYRWQECSMVFQGAQSSLNPVMTIYEQFYETMMVHATGNIQKGELKEKVLRRAKEVLEIVNLDVDRIMPMYPHELSGGMKQRVMIAFSLLLNPKIIILDEPTTALDVITQDSIFKILKNINRDMGVTMILLTHDMGVVAKFADFVGVMYAGKLVEYADTKSVFGKRLHPYTNGLISATPSIIADNSSLKPIEGVPPDLLALPSGCPFHPRCPQAFSKCPLLKPKLIELNNHLVSCHLYDKEETKA
ncbi:MAG TPA: ABC transporter ATP-binding protein [Bacilli bacterium]|nr:ABC transporter ATP-binding protein [Bacilli bacterium]